MMKKFITHLIFFLILEIIYALFAIIYSRDIDLIGGVFWNLALTCLLYLINLIRKRRNKWILLGVICALTLYLTVTDFYEPPLEGGIVYLVVVAAQGNIPFVPKIVFGMGINLWCNIMYYFLYFYGVLFYWYLVYRLSKKIVNKYICR